MPDCRCCACNQHFSGVEQALNHVNAHGIHQRGCVVPGCKRRNPRRLYRHTSGSHPSLCNYHCSSCSRIFVRQCDLSQHANVKHGGLHFTSQLSTKNVQQCLRRSKQRQRTMRDKGTQNLFYNILL